MGENETVGLIEGVRKEGLQVEGRTVGKYEGRMLRIEGGMRGDTSDGVSVGIDE